MGDFASFHPAVSFVYYVLVLAVSMFTLHPVPVVISMAGAFLYFALTHRIRVTVSDAVFYILLFILLSLTNPLFVHNGETILFFMNGNPITLEAFLYGMAMAGMLIGVMYWCKCYQIVMTSDKFLYLFGRAVPRLSLVLSMALRFIPLFKKHAGEVRRVQKTMGMYAGTGITDRLLFSLRVFDSVAGWSLENAIDTADSMRARGYGLKGRSIFSVFPFEKKDLLMLAVLAAAAAAVLGGYFAGVFDFSYYPAADQVAFGSGLIVQTVILSALMLLPAVLEIKEKIKWNYLKSGI